MRFTTTKPTRPGWYWWRLGDFQPQVVQISMLPVVNRAQLDVTVCGKTHVWEVDEMGGEWSSDPILEPQEPV